jgi:hypothetical protein
MEDRRDTDKIDNRQNFSRGKSLLMEYGFTEEEIENGRPEDFHITGSHIPRRAEGQAPVGD